MTACVVSASTAEVGVGTSGAGGTVASGVTGVPSGATMTGPAGASASAGVESVGSRLDAPTPVEGPSEGEADPSAGGDGPVPPEVDGSPPEVSKVDESPGAVLLVGPACPLSLRPRKPKRPSPTHITRVTKMTEICPRCCLMPPLLPWRRSRCCDRWPGRSRRLLASDRWAERA